MKRLIAIIILLVLSIMGFFVACGGGGGGTAAPGSGSLDASFGTGGKVSTSFRSNDHSVNAVAMQADGKIVAVGHAFTGAANVFALARYNTDGSLDPDYGNNGKVTTVIGTTNSRANAVAIQSDGKIMAAGYAYSGTGYVFALARYNTSGSLDTNFDTDGTVTTLVGTIGDRAYAVAIQSDGRIVVAGYSDTGTATVFALARYNTNGSLDESFGKGGRVTTAFGTTNDRAYAVAIQSDGKIVVAGYSVTGTATVFALARYNTNGSLDTSFDVDGKVTTAFGSFDDVVSSVAIQTDGKIVAAGMSRTGTGAVYALARYNTNGSLDTSFDADGKVTTTVGTNAAAYSIAIQANGKIVAVGESDISPTAVFALARYNTDGSLDSGFGTGGMVTTEFMLKDAATAVAIQADGKIVAGGIIKQANSSAFALARYNDDGSLDTSFDTDGKVTTDFWNGDYARAVAIQADGKIVAVGESHVGSDSIFALARYNTDGSLDTNFGTDGKVRTAFGTSNDQAFAVAIQTDGKIVAAGTTGAGSAFALSRYDTNGNLDTSFGTGGKVTTAIGNSAVARGLAIQADGKIVAAGYSDTGTGYVFALARYETNGSLDTSFGTGGKVTTAIGNSAAARGLAIQTDGKIVAAGYSDTGAATVFALARYETNGGLDTSFGIGGKVTTTIGTGAVALDLAIQADGKIVAVGNAGNGTNIDFALARYNTDGSLDASFGLGGKVTTAFGPAGEGSLAYAVAIQADGKIVAAGYSSDPALYPADTIFPLARYNIDGSLDTGFGSGGKVTTAFEARLGYATAAAIQTDGMIVAAGYTASASNAVDDSVFSLVRYLP